MEGLGKHQSINSFEAGASKARLAEGEFVADSIIEEKSEQEKIREKIAELSAQLKRCNEEIASLDEKNPRVPLLRNVAKVIDADMAELLERLDGAPRQ